MTDEIKKLYQAVLEGDLDDTENLVQQALDADLPADVILKEGLIAAMGEVGRLFEEGEFFVPEMLISAHAMKSGLNILRPHLVAADVKPAGKIVIGTVQGDLHDIGKNLVAMMIEGAGFEVIDLGVDVKPEEFIEAVKEHQPDIVGMSALLTTTMTSIKTTIDMMREAGLCDDLKILIGGAPVTQDYADQVSADGFAQDASQAASKALEMID